MTKPTNTENKKSENPLDVIFKALFEISKFLFLILGYFFVGLSTIRIKTPLTIVNAVLILIVSCLLGGTNYLYTWWPDLFQESLGPKLFWLKENLYYPYHLAFFFIAHAYFGYEKRRAYLRIKNGLDFLKKGSDKRYPKILKIKKIGEYKTKLTIEAPHHGLDDFESNKQKLEASFNQMIEEIRRCTQPRFYEIMLTAKVLPKSFKFSEAKKHAVAPCELLFGVSQKGLLKHE